MKLLGKAKQRARKAARRVVPTYTFTTKGWNILRAELGRALTGEPLPEADVLELERRRQAGTITDEHLCLMIAMLACGLEALHGSPLPVPLAEEGMP